MSRNNRPVSCAVALLMTAVPAWARVTAGTVGAAPGLTTATFHLPAGTVRVLLPDDMAAGDTISGTVIAEPAGHSDKDRAANAAVLDGCVVDIAGKGSAVRGAVLRLTIPAIIGSAGVVLKDQTGAAVGAVDVPLAPAGALAPPGIVPPSLGVAGKPLIINGPFDGDLGTTSVSFGGHPAVVIAESPRQAVCQAPVDIGPTTVAVSDGSLTATAPFRSLKIDLHVPRTRLARGERTTVTVTVDGLRGFTDDAVRLVIENNSPGSVTLEGGNRQRLMIEPAAVSSDGLFRWTASATAVQVGAFAMRAWFDTDRTAYVDEARTERRPPSRLSDLQRDAALVAQAEPSLAAHADLVAQIQAASDAGALARIFLALPEVAQGVHPATTPSGTSQPLRFYDPVPVNPDDPPLWAPPAENPAPAPPTVPTPPPPAPPPLVDPPWQGGFPGGVQFVPRSELHNKENAYGYWRLDVIRAINKLWYLGFEAEATRLRDMYDKKRITVDNSEVGEGDYAHTSRTSGDIYLHSDLINEGDLELLARTLLHELFHSEHHVGFGYVANIDQLEDDKKGAGQQDERFFARQRALGHDLVKEIEQKAIGSAKTSG